MDNLIFPMRTMSISQHYSENHMSWDLNGEDTGIDYWYAPCRVKVLAKKRYDDVNKKGFFNTIIFGTCDEQGNQAAVMCADGESRILSIACTHMESNNFDSFNYELGTVYESGIICYMEGNKGTSTGNHVHMDVALGWQTNKIEYEPDVWYLPNLIEKPLDQLFFKLSGWNVVGNDGIGNLNFVTTSSRVASSSTPSPEEPENPGEPETPTVHQTMRLTMTVPTISPNRYPTRPSVNGTYNPNTYFINTGDVVVISDIKAASDGNVVCQIADCLTDGVSSSVLNGRWFVYDKNNFN